LYQKLDTDVSSLLGRIELSVLPMLFRTERENNMKSTKPEYHAAANIFPLDKEHLGSLAKDIGDRGLQVPIEMLDGKIIDGRRRWLACEKAGIEPDVVEVEADDPVGYVLSLNLHRRHLTVSQAAMCAQRARKWYDDAAEIRQEATQIKNGKTPVPVKCPGPGGDARDQVGDVFGVSGKSVDRARRILNDGIPQLATAVDAGMLTVNKAATIASQPDKKLQRQLLAAETQKGGSKVTSPKSKPKKQKRELKEGQFNGVGIHRAHEAINCLMRIPRNDPLKKQGFQLVRNYMRANP
jgi:ParB-like chromosome segregation protein Spo0J